MRLRLVVLLLIFSPALVHAQSSDFTFGVRVAGGLHPTGFELSSDQYSWQHRMQPSVALGVTLWTPVINGRWGARIDAEFLRNVQFDSDPEGPQLTADDGGSIRSVTASVWATPIPSCRKICLDVSAGYGIGRYDFRQQELRGDVVNQVISPQSAGVFRIGFDARFPQISNDVSVFVSDYVVSLEPPYSGERLSAMHLVLVGVGIRN